MLLFFIVFSIVFRDVYKDAGLWVKDLDPISYVANFLGRCKFTCMDHIILEVH